MYASVLCELNVVDVTFIPGKSRIFFVQKFKFECLNSATSRKLIFLKYKTACLCTVDKYAFLMLNLKD